MNRWRAIVFLTIVMAFALGTATAKDAPFLQVGGTASQTALLMPFLAFDADDGIHTALSVSNILAAPEGLLDLTDMNNLSGNIEFYIYRADGHLIKFETTNSTEGNQVLTSSGRLNPGRTFTISLEEILAAKNELPEGGASFVGYGWVVANFDAVQGTVNVFYPDLGFGQALNMEPTFGGVFLAGIPVEIVE
jgi:hypothetical protein